MAGPRGAGVAALGAAAVVLALGACTTSTDVAAVPTGAAAPSASPSASPSTSASPTGPSGEEAGPQDRPSPSATASRPPDPAVDKAPVVKREGALPKAKRADAPPATFRKPLVYTDGVTVEVTEIEQGTSEGQGPGVFVGAPKTAFTVTVTNDSKKPVDLTQVVVTTTYGTPALQAQPVYDDGARDLSGTLEPGASATGLYQFSVPTDRLGDVTTYVDLDGRHLPGTFSGSVD